MSPRRRRAGLLRVRARPGAARLRARRARRAAGRHGPLPAFADTRHDHCDYLLPRGAIGAGLPETEHAMYLRGSPSTAAEAREVLGRPRRAVLRPHVGALLLAPADALLGTRRTAPRSCARERSVYFAHPVFTQYDTQRAALVQDARRERAARCCSPEPLVTPRRAEHAARVAHRAARRAALGRSTSCTTSPSAAAGCFDTIEDVIPLHDLTVSVRTPAACARSRASRAVTPLAHEVARRARRGARSRGSTATH